MPTLITPAQDNKIYQKYTKKTLKNKEKNKIAFCQDFGLKYKKDEALLCLTFPLSEKANLGLLKKALDGILEQPIMLALISVGTKEYQDLFDQLCDAHPGRIVILNETESNKRKIYAASDIFLNTSLTEECVSEMENAMAYGVVPISPEKTGLEDYNAMKEMGNAFIYEGKSHWSFFGALIRALENFKFPYDWKNITSQAMGGQEEDFEEELA